MSELINSLSFDNKTYVLTIPYAICDTPNNVAAKVATLTSNDNFALEIGARVSVKFTHGLAVNGSTLNINGSGAKSIRKGVNQLGSSAGWREHEIVDFVYDGTYWNVVGTLRDTKVYHSSANYSYGPQLMELVMYPLFASEGDAPYVEHENTFAESSSLQYLPDVDKELGIYYGTLYNSGDIVIRDPGNYFGVVPEVDYTGNLGRVGQAWKEVVAWDYLDGDGNRLDSKYASQDHSHPEYISSLSVTDSVGTSGGTSNGHTHLRFAKGASETKYIKITGQGGTQVTSDEYGDITITSANTTYTYPAVRGGRCDTPQDTSEKTVNISGFITRYLTKGATIDVLFYYPHQSTSAATLNVNKTGAKTIKRNGANVTASNTWDSYELVKLMYDGTYWNWVDEVSKWNTF